MIGAGLAAADLGERLRAARSGANLTQDAAAAALGMARTTLLAIEKGHRPVRPEELLALARLYGVSAGRLTSPDAIHVDLSAMFRRAEGKEASKAAADALALLNRLATGAVQLERLVGHEPRTDYPPPIRVNPRRVNQQAEDAANNLRARLGVGLGPIPDPIGLLELELGLRIFFRPLPSQISGLYAYDPAIGACILINANHHWKRRVQTAIHETGHFASDRSHADILEEEEISPSIDERFARRFGSAFLMPASGVRARFDQVVGSENRFDVPRTDPIGLPVRRCHRGHVSPAGGTEPFAARDVGFTKRSRFGERPRARRDRLGGRVAKATGDTDPPRISCIACPGP